MRASSESMLWSHGGSKVSSTSHPVINALLNLGKYLICHWASGSRESHLDENLVLLVYHKFIDKSKIVDIDRNLRIIDLLDGHDDIVV